MTFLNSMTTGQRAEFDSAVGVAAPVALLQNGAASIPQAVTDVTALKNATVAIKDQVTALQGAVASALAVDPRYIQFNAATPTVPPAAVASAAVYYAVNADLTYGQAYTNNAGTGVIVSGLKIALGAAVEAISGAILKTRPRSGWLRATVNQKTGRVLDGTRANGKRHYSGITRSVVDPSFAAILPMAVRGRSGWAIANVNANGRVLSGVRSDGRPHSPGATFLDKGLQRRVFKERNTSKQVEPDLIQSAQQGVGSWTHRSGYPWSRLSFMPSPKSAEWASPGGSNIPLQFRKRLPVAMPGIRSMGDWSPDAAANGVASLKKVGTLSNTTDYGHRKYDVQSLPAVTGYSEGDYWTVHPIGGGSIDMTASGFGIAYPGDLVVLRSGAWVIQRRPAGAITTTSDHDWWNVTTAGVFDGVTYAVGDRIVGYGMGYYHRYARGRKELGDKFLRGEFDASAGALPASPVQGDVWQVSVAGTVSGLVLAVDDWILYDGAQFYSVPTTPITAVAANKAFMLFLDGNLADYEVRRSDKAATTTPVRLLVQSQVATRVENNDVLVIGDSMVHFLRGYALTAFSDRTIWVEGFDSADASEVAAMFEQFVMGQGNKYTGRAVFPWFGQNNENDWQITINALLRIMRLCARFDIYVAPVIAAGRREFTFNGTRLVGKWQEAMKIGTDTTNGLVMQQNMTKQLVGPSWCLDARQIAVDAVAANPASFSGPDKQFPGMTEAQTAAAYGLIPLSCYIGNDANVAASVNFLGYWSSDTLPTGGAAGDYYVRSGGTSNRYVGNLVSNINGTWTELATGDRNVVVHWSNAIISTALANAMRSFVNLNNW